MLLTEGLLPNLSEKCRIANISSLLGALKYQPNQAQVKFANPNITKDDILAAVE